MFNGTGVALITPFHSNGTIDFGALGRLIDSVIEGGVNYLVALGTTGETPTLSKEEKDEVLAYVVKQNAGRVPVVCGIGGNDTAEVYRTLKRMELSGVDGILMVAPYYNKPTQEGLYQHFKALALATDKPVILYNVPGRTASNILPQTVLRLAADFKNIVAIKEASGNIVQCMELIQQKPEGFTVLSGDDNLAVAQIAIGMEGIISVAANCWPKQFTGMINAALRNDYVAARKAHYKLLSGIDLLFVEGNPAGVKCVLNQSGMCEEELRLPLVPVSALTVDKIKSFIATL